MTIIQDGGGKGVKAGVNDDGRLEAESHIIRPLAYVSQFKGQAFQLSVGPLVVTTTEGMKIWGENTSSNLIFAASRIYLHWNGGDTNGDKMLIAKIRPGTTEPTGNYATIPATAHSGNLNLSSRITPQMDFRFHDGTGDGMTVSDDGNDFISLYYDRGTNVMEWEGGLLLPPASIMSLAASGGEAGTLYINILGTFIEPRNGESF